MRHQAAEHAEELLEIALGGPSQATLQAILAGMPLIDREFAALVGPLDGLVAAADESTEPARPLSPRASAVLASVDHPMTVAEVLAGSPLPTRDCIRVLAALLRSRALVHGSRQTQ